MKTLPHRAGVLPIFTDTCEMTPLLAPLTFLLRHKTNIFCYSSQIVY